MSDRYGEGPLSIDPTDGDGRRPSAADPATIDPALILAALEQVIVGRREALELVLATLLSGGHVLLEDRPGVGKTLLAKALAAVLGIGTARIQGTPDLLPTDVTGVDVYQPGDGSWQFRPGPVFTSLLLVDELNRATPKAQSALLEAMAEGHVTVDGRTRPLAHPFLVIATQNPLGEIGTHQLGAAQTDRFATRISLGLPERRAEHKIVMGRAGAGHLARLRPVVPAGGLPHLFGSVAAVVLADALAGYILDGVDSVRQLSSDIWLSVRVGEVTARVARGHAFLRGRDHVAPEDVRAVLPAVLDHRLPPSLDRETIGRALDAVAVPRGAG